MIESKDGSFSYHITNIFLVKVIESYAKEQGITKTEVCNNIITNFFIDKLKEV